jgi:hypothetical protein
MKVPDLSRSTYLQTRGRSGVTGRLSLIGRTLVLAILTTSLVAPGTTAKGHPQGADREPAGDALSTSIGPDYAPGPLVVSAANPRYFTTESGSPKVVLLSGSHVWNNFEDGLGPGLACAESAEANDYDAYLRFLKDHGHNFIRLWRWEHVKSQAPGAPFHLCMTPQPWLRSGPGSASDGLPKFDLSTFDQGYFDRLRGRVVAAGNAGIYVSIMLFDGFCLIVCPAPDNVEGHPFFVGNNVNGVSITSVVDYEVLPLEADIQALQAAYIRKVVDTVHDLPNVLYEVANESAGDADDPAVGDSTDWQYWVINTLKAYERQKGYERHPVGMSFQIASHYPIGPSGLPQQPVGARPNDSLFNSPADWISPGFEVEYFTDPWFTDPPENLGAKVVLSDTDHYASGTGDAIWAWKTFFRGHNPIFMDFGIMDAGDPLPNWEPARDAMGDILRLSRKVSLVDLEPQGSLSSTGYVLANPGDEYLVLQPSSSGESFTLDLRTGRYAVSWFSIDGRRTEKVGRVLVDHDSAVAFEAPFASGGPSFLHLERIGP